MELALRGFVISRTGVLPTDPSFQELSRNPELLRFTAHWLRRRDDDQQKMLWRALGVTWSRTEVERMLKAAEQPDAPDDVFIPLAMAINGQLRDALEKIFKINQGTFVGGGEYTSQRGEQVVALDESVSREDFKKMVGAANQAEAAVERRRDPVTVEDSDGAADPRIKRIREQIAHSKQVR